MRKLLIVTLILFATLSTALITHAWFTYVQRKSIAQFVSNEIVVETRANDELILDQFDLDELAYIDFENDLMNDLSNVFDEMATSIDIDIILSSNSPLTRHIINVDVNHDAIIMLIVYEGINLGSQHQKNTAYYSLIQTIYSPLTERADIMDAIYLYNQSILNDIKNTTLFPGDKLSFQLVFWVDYDLIEYPENYLDYEFSMTVSINSVSAKKEVD
ncbi:MAG: hypothetical protein CVV57_03545 [Tenericutes bacterium HGW-Tenericutes-2]|nr:MAG: hypothetical protein CVV57_03545 [Tenericutes bacterium HGW-Tenericutes-2]